MPKKLILSSFGKYGALLTCVVLIAGTLSLGFSRAIGLKTDTALLDVIAPIFGDGNGGGAVPMANIASESGYAANENTYYAKILAIVVVSNIIMIISSAVLGKKAGQSKYSGKGKLLKRGIFIEPETKKPKVRHLTIALVLFAAIFLLGHTLEHVIKINTKSELFKNGIIISQFAWSILIALAINLAGIVPEEVRLAGQKISDYFTKEFTFIVMTGIGLGIDFKVFANDFDHRLIYATIVTDILLLLTPFLLAKAFGMYPFEAMIAAGACMGGMGGGGAVACMSACNRLSLMSYSQITCRLAGSMILIIASPLYSVFAA